MKDCSFRRVKAEGSKEGGGMKIKIEEGGEVKMETVITELCYSKHSGGEGKGGFLYFESSFFSSSFLLSSVSFSSNEATYGKNLYIKTSSLNHSISLSLFSFDLPPLNELDRGKLMMGEDSSSSSSFFLACFLSFFLIFCFFSSLFVFFIHERDQNEGLKEEDGVINTEKECGSESKMSQV
jgi:hypothetical protein